MNMVYIRGIFVRIYVCIYVALSFVKPVYKNGGGKVGEFVTIDVYKES